MSIRLLIITCTLFSFSLPGQSTYQIGLMPSLNLNKSLDSGWKFNLKLETRQSIQSGIFDDFIDTELDYLLTDIALLASKQIGFSDKVAGGYQVRFREGETVHRTILQYILVRKYEGFKIAYRLGFDQTYFEASPTANRIRLRLGSEFPLNGEEADQREFYLKVTNEYLNIFQKEEHDLEIRLIPLLGYLIGTQNKLEAGLDYRLDSFLEGPSDHNFWFRINWFYSI